MSDLDRPDDNLTEFTVSEVSGAIKRHIEDSFGYVRVRGELGRVARPASGHLYFDLKDDRAVLAAVMWKGTSSRLSVTPEQGLEVICTGNLTTFPGQSRYQLVVQHMEPAGEGALMALLEARRKALAAEGLFDTERKVPLPFLPQIIGVVTSPSGAVIRDILHRLADRFPRHVLVWPVRVQGEGSADEVCAAIAGFNALAADGAVPRPDVLIVARGGGSVEDLWSFNEESVVRAVAASQIPVISAIGHETDTTLIDYVADVRAPTPTAAAEMAVPVRADLQAHCLTLQRRLGQAMARQLSENRMRAEVLGRGLPKPMDIFATARQRVDLASEALSKTLLHYVRMQHAALQLIATRLAPRLLARPDLGRQIIDLAARLDRAMMQQVQQSKSTLTFLMRQLQALSHEQVLARGYALVVMENGQLLRTPSEVKSGDNLTIMLAEEARVTAHVTAQAEGSARAQKPTLRKKTKSPHDEQGDLF